MDFLEECRLQPLIHGIDDMDYISTRQWGQLRAIAGNYRSQKEFESWLLSLGYSDLRIPAQDWDKVLAAVRRGDIPDLGHGVEDSSPDYRGETWGT